MSTLPAGTALEEEDAESFSAGEGGNAVAEDGSIRFLYRDTKGNTVSFPCALRSAHCEVTKEMLSMISVLVDGKFVVSEKDLTLRFRGSRNQRLVSVQSSLEQGKVVLWDV
ncbi:MAG: 4Fe-4S cluster-binding domain-containing protein [Lachnospiraceae bacterium]|nr:4Fe-4S cluster-binding domain-containing protein [Lachnospiraceae bacterium]